MPSPISPVSADAILHYTALGLGAHMVVTPLFFFLLPYPRRRAALQESYGDKRSATTTLDASMLVTSGAVAALALRQASPSDIKYLLCGTWLGATLITTSFHRFSMPLSKETEPHGEIGSPIKTMSYAIQASPERGWKELSMLGVIVLGCVGRLYL